MSEHQQGKEDLSQGGDEALDRMVTALRDAPMPEGPSPRLVQQTQAALRDAAGRAGHGSLGRIIPSGPLPRLAAAIVLLTLGAMIFWAVFFRPTKPLQTKIDPPKVVPHDHGDHQTAPTPPPVVSLPGPSVAEGVHPKPPVPDNSGVESVVSGRVIFAGVPPVMAQVAQGATMAECAKHHQGPIYDESIVVNANGTLANVVVSVSGGLPEGEWFPAPGDAAVLDQKGCVFRPHVLAVMVGQPVVVKNSDPVLHNVREMAVNNPSSNFGQPTIGATSLMPFKEPEVFRVKCDIHPWMEAWVRVVDNPYFAVTAADGSFTLRGLPPGKYRIKAWHERLGVREQEVTVQAGHATTTDFTFHAGAK
jgi:plastocyanin